MSKETILAEILAERARQDEKWGGPEHDDEHDPGDWARFVRKQCDRTDRALASKQWDAAVRMARQNFVKIAALAVAAIEAIDRAA